MSSIPPNIAMALLQAQYAAKEAAKPGQSQRNKRAADSKRLAQLADQQQHEVEDTTEVDLTHVQRDDGQRQKERDADESADVFEQQKDRQDKQSADQQQPENPQSKDSQSDQDHGQGPSAHIDLSA